MSLQQNSVFSEQDIYPSPAKLSNFQLSNFQPTSIFSNMQPAGRFSDFLPEGRLLTLQPWGRLSFFQPADNFLYFQPAFRTDFPSSSRLWSQHAGGQNSHQIATILLISKLSVSKHIFKLWACGLNFAASGIIFKLPASRHTLQLPARY